MSDLVDVVSSNSESADAQQNKALGILAYIGILVLVPIIAGKDSRFAKFHANQGLVLFLCGLVISASRWIPPFGHTIWSLGSLVVFVFAILGIVNAAQGLMKPLPLIGEIKILS